MSACDSPGRSQITRADWEHRHGHRGALVWLTGLPGSGKSTLAYTLERRLYEDGRQVVVLDGDRVRSGLSQDLGFSDADRHEQLRRVAEVAALLLQTGTIVLAALITPRAVDHQWLRQRFQTDTFLEVYCRCPGAVCAARDPKGHYARAQAGSMAGFTGVSAPYEPPSDPDLIADTEHGSVADCVAILMGALQQRGVWTPDVEAVRADGAR